MTDLSVTDDQQQPLRILTTFLQNGTVPHALLFVGIDGIGKSGTAVTFAMASNCLGEHSEDPPRAARMEPCGRCKACRKIKSGNHPDILRIQPDGSVIKIDRIREVCRVLTLKPNEARTRVVILEQAQRMNAAAGNALLKVLEEPPLNTIFILIADQAESLMPTIVSRCQKIRFRPIAEDRLTVYLAQHADCGDSAAAVVARMAQGSLSRAMQMATAAEGVSWFTRRKWLLQASGLDRDNGPETVSTGDCLAMAQRMAENKKQLQNDLDILKTYLRDVLVIRYAPQLIIHTDLEEQIARAAKACPVESLLAKLDSLQQVERNLNTSANLRLMTETLCLQLSAAG